MLEIVGSNPPESIRFFIFSPSQLTSSRPADKQQAAGRPPPSAAPPAAAAMLLTARIVDQGGMG